MKKHKAVTFARRESLWPVVGLMLLAVAVPTACVLWFMTAAMRNERLAVQQKLTAVRQPTGHPEAAASYLLAVR